MASARLAEGRSAWSRQPRPAPLLLRGVAAVLDGIFGVAVVAFVVRDRRGRPWIGAMGTARGGLGVWCGVGWLYAVLFEHSALQATLGKVVVNVRVQPLAGDRVGVRAAALRNALRLVDLQPCLTYAVGIIAALRRPSRQRVGDRVARTWVARHRFDPAERAVCLLVLTVPVVALACSYRRRPAGLGSRA